MTAPFRVASKGVYADGGSITETRRQCKFVGLRPINSFGLVEQAGN
ncbi:hypothetical protein SAMN05428967_0236 [Phyllobacterium sp. YR620]|nr:hypothetical protein SAMN05428967_0236 [Phyllobacterium sp. YR620]